MATHNIIYFPISRKMFTGFVSKHPGAEPRGHLEATWSKDLAWLIPKEDLLEIISSLDRLGEIGFTTAEVTL